MNADDFKRAVSIGFVKLGHTRPLTVEDMDERFGLFPRLNENMPCLVLGSGFAGFPVIDIQDLQHKRTMENLATTYTNGRHCM